jgi:hypothetical protein
VKERPHDSEDSRPSRNRTAVSVHRPGALCFRQLFHFEAGLWSRSIKFCCPNVMVKGAVAEHETAPCVLTCLLSTLTFLPAQATRRALSHTKPQRTPRRSNKAHGLNAKILAPFILSVIKKQITSCRRHEACLLNFLLFNLHLSGGAARPLRLKKSSPSCAARFPHTLPLNCPILTFLPAVPARPNSALIFSTGGAKITLGQTPT